MSNDAKPEFRNWQAPWKIKEDSVLPSPPFAPQEAEDNEGPKVRVKKGWGREDWLLNSKESNLCVKILSLKCRKACSFHFHRNKAEIFFVISGDMDFEWRDTETGNPEQMALKAGDSVYIPPGCPHRFSTINPDGCVFLEASTFHEDSDSYRIAPGDSQNADNSTPDTPGE